MINLVKHVIVMHLNVMNALMDMNLNLVILNAILNVTPHVEVVSMDWMIKPAVNVGQVNI